MKHISCSNTNGLIVLDALNLSADNGLIFKISAEEIELRIFEARIAGIKRKAVDFILDDMFKFAKPGATITLGNHPFFFLIT